VVLSSETLRDLLSRNLMPDGRDRELNERYENRVIFTSNRHLALVPVEGGKPVSPCPIWVVRAKRNRDLLKDHNHIFQENFMRSRPRSCGSPSPGQPHGHRSIPRDWPRSPGRSRDCALLSLLRSRPTPL
jgi:hypothetical protein